MSIEKGTGLSSPNTSLVLPQLMDEESSLGGVPVFNLPALKPREVRDSVIPSDLFSLSLPALIFSSPICIKPFKKVPQVKMAPRQKSSKPSEKINGYYGEWN